MAKQNPYAGGPDYIQVLAAALSQRTENFTRPMPPASGGTQVSHRMLPERIAMLDTIAEQTGWNRNQVLIGLIDSALFRLYDALPEKDAKRVTLGMVEKVMK